MDNYIQLKTVRKRILRFCFVDDDRCSAASLFFKHKVAPKVTEIMKRPDEKYRLCICNVYAPDKQKFIDAMKELPIKMQLVGNTDYNTHVERLMKYLTSDQKPEEYLEGTR